MDITELNLTDVCKEKEKVFEEFCGLIWRQIVIHK